MDNGKSKEWDIRQVGTPITGAADVRGIVKSGTRDWETDVLQRNRLIRFAQTEEIPAVVRVLALSGDHERFVKNTASKALAEMPEDTHIPGELRNKIDDYVKEAGLLTDILENNGFEVVSVQCKAGCVPKEEIGIEADEKIAGPDNWETMCNPIVQAMIINRTQVDLAIMLGLCIGHDTLFIKYCDVPLTVLAVKDRLLAHNPLAALYLSESYYRRLRNGVD